MPRQGSGKVIYLDEVAQMLRAGVAFDTLCQRLGVDEKSVIRAYRRARLAGRPTPGIERVRTERERLWQERQDAHNAKRRAWRTGAVCGVAR